MNRLNADGIDDGIDEDMWFKPVFNPKTGKSEMPPVINPFRAAKGDIKRNEDDKLESRQWLPDALKEKGIIEKEHHDTCKSFQRILLHAKRTLNICELRGPLFDESDGEIQKTDTDMYIEIKNGLVKVQFKSIIWLVEEGITDSNIWAACAIIGNIKHGLENAQKIIIDNSNRKLTISKSTLPEVSLNSPRQQV